MGYLIYTDRINLLMSIKRGLIRIPRNLRVRFDLRTIRKGDTIFLFDFENNKLYGPILAAADNATEEKNPKDGPFNGYGNVKKHYIYDALKIDCSKAGKRGIQYECKDDFRFIVSKEDDEVLQQKLELINGDKVPVVLNFTISEGSLKAAVVKLKGVTHINNYVCKNPDNLLSLLRKKKRIGEALLSGGKNKAFVNNLKDMGQLIYDNIFKPIDLESLFTEGGYTVYISGDDQIKEIPFEVSYNDLFIFERNTVVYSGAAEHKERSIKIKKVLIIADPSSRYHNAYEEGVELFRLFSESNIATDFISREIDNDLINDLFPDYDIVHFAGHSRMEDSKVGWDIGGTCFTFTDILVQGRLPHLVFSSSCGNTLKFGLALLGKGVKNVIASRWQIPDYDMRVFVLSFYNLLLSGIEIGDAISSALTRSYWRGEVLPLLFTLHGESRMVYEK
ncbi:MAG: CHAT domain-containing protein [Spirochaetota bacterium]|nr:MAG: CHAT domain-containing protein [Spirochaetota bacterium]